VRLVLQLVHGDLGPLAEGQRGQPRLLPLLQNHRRVVGHDLADRANVEHLGNVLDHAARLLVVEPGERRKELQAAQLDARNLLRLAARDLRQAQQVVDDVDHCVRPRAPPGGCDYVSTVLSVSLFVLFSC